MLCLLHCIAHNAKYGRKHSTFTKKKYLAINVAFAENISKEQAETAVGIFFFIKKLTLTVCQHLSLTVCQIIPTVGARKHERAESTLIIAETGKQFFFILGRHHRLGLRVRGKKSC